METETVKTVKHTPLPWRCAETKSGYLGQPDSEMKSFISIMQDLQGNGPCACVAEVEEGTETYKFGSGYRHKITKEIADANAEFIVRACNSHYELLESLQWALNNLNNYDKPSPEEIEKYNKAVAAVQKATK